MKLLLVLFFAATCQAFSVKSMIEKEAFEFMINEATEELEKLAVQEFENVILSDNKEISTVQRRLINKFATYFSATLREEISAIVDDVIDASDAKTAFAQKMYENLREASFNISQGLHMAPKAAEKFLHDMMSDIEAMEKSGTFILDIENMFKNVMHKVSGMLSYELIEKRGWLDILGKINDTLAKIVGNLHGKFNDLHDFLKTIVKSAGEKLHPHITNIKILAKDFINHINKVNAVVAKEALEFFRPFATLLGNTWIKLVEKVHQRLHQIIDQANTTPSY